MDAQSRAAFWAAMEGLKAQGRTILLTTHYLEEVEKVADRVVIMNAGTILADDTPEHLRSVLRGTRVRFKSDLAQAELQQLPGVEWAKVDARGYAQVTTACPEQLLAALVQSGTTFTELEVTRASLEEAFLNLTHPSPDHLHA